MKNLRPVLCIVVLEAILILGYLAIFRHSKTPQPENQIRKLNQPSHKRTSMNTKRKETVHKDILPRGGVHSRAKDYIAIRRNVLANQADSAETQQLAPHNTEHNQNFSEEHSQLARHDTVHNQNFPEEHPQLAPRDTEHSQPSHIRASKNTKRKETVHKDTLRRGGVHSRAKDYIANIRNVLANQADGAKTQQLAPHNTEHNQNFPEEHPQLAWHDTERNQNFPGEHPQLAPQDKQQIQNSPEEHSPFYTHQTSTMKHSNSFAADPDKVHSPYMRSFCKVNKTLKKHKLQLTPDTKLIMYWQEKDNYPEWRGGFKQICSFPTAGPCEITWDESYRARANAVVFLASSLLSDTLPFQKLPGQIWVARAFKSPVHWHSPYRSRMWRGVFNWTFTYRPDSDIFSSVGALVKIPPRDNVDYRQIALHKSRSVAWFVSDCTTLSKREKYVEEMRKYIDIDIYGECGTLECSKDEKGDCFSLLSKKYLFYLSFENSLCNYYVTETFFNKFGNIRTPRHVIPVVRGGTNYRKYFPEGTFIDAADFKTPKDLALYLKKLGHDPDTYTAMLARKDHFGRDSCPRNLAWCKLCDMLHDKNLKPKYYEDLAAWLDQEQCVEPMDI